MGMIFDLEQVSKLVGPCDFIVGNIDNIYRTKDFIIVQKLAVRELNGEAQLMSSDTFYRRTPLRDMQYDKIFEFRGRKINGKRIVSNIAVRKLAQLESKQKYTHKGGGKPNV